MNYMKQVAEMLGVELGEKFRILYPSGDISELCYAINHDGLMNIDNLLCDSIFRNVLNGKYQIIKPWKPQNGGRYFIPNLKSGEAYCTKLRWDDKPWDEKRYKAGMVCKTANEAVEKAEKMLAALKEE